MTGEVALRLPLVRRWRRPPRLLVYLACEIVINAGLIFYLVVCTALQAHGVISGGFPIWIKAVMMIIAALQVRDDGRKLARWHARWCDGERVPEPTRRQVWMVRIFMPVSVLLWWGGGIAYLIVY